VFLKSLALVTELGVLASRARITYRNDCVIVETPDQPGWTDGNFLVLPRPLASGELSHWIDRFAEELGEHRAVSLRCDDAHGGLGDEAELRSAGFSIDVHELLVADEVIAPAAPPALPIRSLQAEDIAATGELAWEISDRHDEAHRALLDAHSRWLASLVAQRRALFVGAFDGRKLVASLGVIPLGTIARYQQVQTRPTYRRHGLASALLALAARLSHGHSRFAILTEPASAAMRVYQRVGFKASERSTRALRFPRHL
jgi:GNAT superfamily N-acetyltransferase